MKSLATLPAVLLLAVSCATTGNHSSSIRRAQVISIMERTADWQLAHPARYRSTDWTQGAFYTGVMALDDISTSPRFREAMVRMGETNQWKLGPRIYHADDQVVGQTYSELWLRYRDNRMITPMKEQFDYILGHPVELPIDHSRKNGEDQWSWCDALFMGPPTWIRLHAVTGDPRYLDFAVTNWWRTSDHLYDASEHLYFRDNSYFTKRESNGAKVFWSRGNGWVMAGLVRMLEFLPPNHPSRPRFLRQYREMAEKILTVQQSDGLWRSSLLDPVTYPLQETSGSSFYTYALAWGVNEGLLSRKKFQPAVERAWTALVTCVDPDGKLTHVQPIGADPRKFAADSTDCFGVGAFLLAGSEIYRLAK